MEQDRTELQVAVRNFLRVWDKEIGGRLRLEHDVASHDLRSSVDWIRAALVSETAVQDAEVEVDYADDFEDPFYAGVEVFNKARRRSGAKNISEPKYQQAFANEARAAMGQPNKERAESLLGRRVRLLFNVDWPAVEGELTDVNDEGSSSSIYLILDRKRNFPLNAVQDIQDLSDR